MRKLAIMSAAFSAGIFAANYLLPSARLVPAAVISAALGLAALLLCLILKRRRCVLALALLPLAIGLAFYRFAEISRSEPAKAFASEEREISVRMLTYPTEGKNCLKAEAVIISDELPRLHAMIYDYNGLIAETEPGEIYSFTAKVSAADTMYGEDYDGYMAKNVFLSVRPKSELSLISPSGWFDALPRKLAKALCDAADTVFPSDAAPFIKSLLMGDRTDFYTQRGLRLDFGRAGIMHVVAISGMHISMLAGLITQILGKSRKSSVLCLVLIWLFTAAVGAPPSAVRAAVMQSSLLTASVFRKENDGITSLFFALAVLLAVNPFSCASIGLQLSFAAILGIVLFGERLQELFKPRPGRGLWHRIARYVSYTLATSLAATVFTLPLMAVHFGYVSVLAPVANILCLWGVSVCFAFGLLSCVVGVLLPAVAAVIALPAVWISRYIFFAVGLVADIPYCALYTSNPIFMIWLLFAAVLTGVFFLLKVPKAVKYAVPLVGSALALIAAVVAVRYLSPANGGLVSVLDVGQGQCITAMSGDATVMIDCGSTASPTDPGETAKSYLERMGRRRIDALFLTHCHTDHASGLLTLIELERIGTIYMPPPDDEQPLAEEVAALAEKHGIELVYLSSGTELTVGDMRIRVFIPEATAKSDEVCAIYTLSLHGLDTLITGDNRAKLERQFVEREDASGIELLIVGHHGSKYSACEELLDEIGSGTAVISVGYNSYGHPTEETLARLDERGYNVFRTDLDGTVEIPAS